MRRQTRARYQSPMRSSIRFECVREKSRPRRERPRHASPRTAPPASRRPPRGRAPDGCGCGCRAGGDSRGRSRCRRRGSAAVRPADERRTRRTAPCATQGADRHFQVVTAPAAFARSAGPPRSTRRASGVPPRLARAPSAQNAGSIGAKPQPAQHGPGALREVGEQRRHRGRARSSQGISPVQRSNGSETACGWADPTGGAGRQTQRRGLDRVVVDDEVDRRQAVPPGQAVQGEVLDPDARMKQLGLMAGQKEMFAESTSGTGSPRRLR